MERHYTCVICKAEFKVANENPKPVEPEVALHVHCPACDSTNRITWPNDTNYIVGPK